MTEAVSTVPTVRAPTIAREASFDASFPRFQPVAMLVGLIVALSFLGRIVLTARAAGSMSWKLADVAGALSVGLLYDLSTASYFAIPLVIYLVFVPGRIFDSRLHRWWGRLCRLALIYGLLFVAAAEWFFWTEFGSRFNFIAVDYLVYTTEVVGNIRESYPVGWILAALMMPALAILAVSLRWESPRRAAGERSSFPHRLAIGAALLLFPLLATAIVTNRMCPSFGNLYNQEIARNGIYSFFAAFRDNELDYDRFYSKLESDQAFERLRGLLKTDNARYLTDDPKDIARWITGDETEKHYNVIQITVESLSADFMGVFGNTRELTPNLDRIAEEGILFTGFRATGTRTVRGMEALTLSLPPTPGRSIVKRSGNEGLFSLGSVFRSRGYDTVFLYGGYGYFDNMNAFFSGNGYRIVDRGTQPEDAVTFSTIWGAADEDLFRWVIDEADRDYAAQTPFFHFVMTTSNHRPYTYPDGRIDIPSGTGRDGAVKYTDFAIGNFIDEARTKPWFDETVFVIVADHCASSAGRWELPVRNYEIPLIVYNPGLFAPQRVARSSSQIDYAPTLLSLMGWSYASRFYGRDILHMEDRDERAFVATYQKLGLMEGEQVAILKPVRHDAVFAYEARDGALIPAGLDAEIVGDAIAYYQTASELFDTGRYTSIPPMGTDLPLETADLLPGGDTPKRRGDVRTK